MDLGYLFASPEGKTRRLMALAQRDPVFTPIVEDLEGFGHHITYSYWGHSGEYTPYALEAEPEDLEKHFMAQWQSGTIKAQFHFSTRYGFAVNAHYALHELMHFHQDMYGLFYTALRAPGTRTAMPDERSYIGLHLLCESLAEIEAIRASYRLKIAGHPAAWHGALISFDWRSLAKSYEADLNAGIKDPAAALNLFKNWLNTPQRKYYERRAVKTYKALPAAKHYNIDLNQALQRLPVITNPAFLKDINVNTVMDLTDYTHAKNPWPKDTPTASPPYLWRAFKGMTHLF